MKKNAVLCLLFHCPFIICTVASFLCLWWLAFLTAFEFGNGKCLSSQLDDKLFELVHFKHTLALCSQISWYFTCILAEVQYDSRKTRLCLSCLKAPYKTQVDSYSKSWGNCSPVWGMLYLNSIMCHSVWFKWDGKNLNTHMGLLPVGMWACGWEFLLISLIWKQGMSERFFSFFWWGCNLQLYQLCINISFCFFVSGVAQVKRQCIFSVWSHLSFMIWT